MAKPKMTNLDVIKTLCKAGYKWSEGSGIEWDESKQEAIGPFGEFYAKRHGFPHNYYYRPQINSHMIPVDIFKKECYSNYRIMLPKGTQVRRRRSSTRAQARSRWNDKTDSQRWHHLGIGSGKEYKSDKIREFLFKSQGIPLHGELDFYAKNKIRRFKQDFSTSLLIGNEKYATNIIESCNKTMNLNDRGIKKTSSWYPTQFRPHDFVNYITIKQDGVLGPKSLINGVIQEVFVYFLYPSWESKRESRYKVLFETGASGIFTSDFLERVYDTDIEPDEKLMICSNFNNSCAAGCQCGGIHKEGLWCSTGCYASTRCEIFYDYTNFIDTTYSKALEYVE